MFCFWGTPGEQGRTGTRCRCYPSDGRLSCSRIISKGSILMDELATFDEADWEDLTAADKKALKTFSRVSMSYEPLAKAPGVGQLSMDALVAKGLAEEGQPCLHGRTFKLSDKGWLAVEWINGRKTRVYPRA